MCDRLKMGRRVENVDNVEKMQKIEKKSKKAVDIFINLYYTYVRNRDEAWLSLVERCVRDAEVASSNLVASTPGPDGQAVKTTPSHGVNPGSIPGQVTCCCVMQQHFLKVLPWLSW